mgnify:FL=1
MKINHSPSYYYRLPKLARLVTINMYTVKQRGGKLMKVKLNINSNLNEEKAEFWIKKMTTKIEQITKELNSKQDFLWCYQDRDVFQVKYSDIFLIQVENEKTQIYTQSDKYIFKGRLYQIEKNLPSDFIMASRSAVINYRKLDHLKMLENGNIDAILENKIDVQISRRKIKNLKEKLGL